MKFDFDEAFFKKSGYNATLIGLGITIGALGFFNLNPTDEELIEQNGYYKDENFQLDKAVERLEAKTETLESQEKELTAENESLQQLLDEKEKSFDELSKEHALLKETLKNGEVNAAVPVSSSKLAVDQTKEFLNGGLYVSLMEVNMYSVKIQIGADGYEAEIYSDAAVGSQYLYDANGKYQIRITDVDRDQQQITVQVKQL